MNRTDLIRGVLDLVQSMGCIKSFEIEERSVKITKENEESVTYNLSKPIEFEEQIVKGVTIGPVTLEHETFLPFYQVNFRLYPELIQDIRATVDPASEFQMIGKQLSDGIRKARQKKANDENS